MVPSCFRSLQGCTGLRGEGIIENHTGQHGGMYLDYIGTIEKKMEITI